jgi:hypothetical protein
MRQEQSGHSNPTQAPQKIRREFRAKPTFDVVPGIIFPGGVYAVCDQNSRTHATTMWRFGLAFACFEICLNIQWMNR